MVKESKKKEEKTNLAENLLLMQRDLAIAFGTVTDPFNYPAFIRMALSGQ